MIDNVILLITGTLHQRPIAELVPKCHPLGSFEQMEAVSIAQTPSELFNAILVDTPLGMNDDFSFVYRCSSSCAVDKLTLSHIICFTRYYRILKFNL